MEPLWQLIINSESLNRMLPALEAILSKLKSPELAERAVENLIRLKRGY